MDLNALRFVEVALMIEALISDDSRLHAEGTCGWYDGAVVVSGGIILGKDWELIERATRFCMVSNLVVKRDCVECHTESTFELCTDEAKISIFPSIFCRFRIGAQASCYLRS